MNSIELFAGAGGLALGVEAAGFRHKAVIELDEPSCQTLRLNNAPRGARARKWRIVQSDVREIQFRDFEYKIDLLGGGPPCQPFSLGGKHGGRDDARNLFPEAIRAVREIKPKAILFENVRGLVRPSFFNYFQYICLRLEFPTILRGRDESWEDHQRRLERHKSSKRRVNGLSYNIISEVLNAADYGIPQRRERVFIVGFRSDLGVEWSFPASTHSREQLLADQIVSGEYWERHELSKRHRERFISNSRADRRRLSQLALAEFPLLPWRTTRDALGGLPDPRSTNGRLIQNHVYQPGARQYHGHTGSSLDEPAKTLKAGDHGVPGGENMVVLDDGSVRYFTVRESARLQTFPDSYVFPASWTENMRQIGNAVPVSLGKMLADSIAVHIG